MTILEPSGIDTFVYILYNPLVIAIVDHRWADRVVHRIHVAGRRHRRTDRRFVFRPFLLEPFFRRHRQLVRRDAFRRGRALPDRRVVYYSRLRRGGIDRRNTDPDQLDLGLSEIPHSPQ